MTSRKVLLTSGLAVAFPVVSYGLLKSQALPPHWLGLPDGILAIGLFMGLGIQAGPALRTLLAIGTMVLGMVGFNINPDLTGSLMPVVVNLLLARLFQMTLEKGAEPIISRIARIARQDPVLPVELAAYTRQLTAAWAGFFLLLTLNSLLLAILAPIETVMLFANSLNMIFIALFFVLENLYRRFRYHQHGHTPLRQLIGTLAIHGWQMDHCSADQDIEPTVPGKQSDR